jgi:hypothetical protein
VNHSNKVWAGKKVLGNKKQPLPRQIGKKESNTGVGLIVVN